MNIPLSWLKDFLDFSLSSEEIAETLTLAGIEVEEITTTPSDAILSVSLTPNLGHCQSILGIARELAALLNLKLKKRTLALKEDASSIEGKVAVKIRDEKACSRYTCRLVKNVHVVPSPAWLKERLEAAGLRSINNIVDVGNYVMLELGHPLHLFNYAKIRGKEIVISSAAHPGELVTLDGELRKIPQGALLINDAEGPIAFAGVIGGQESAVTEETKDVLIESAVFLPEAVRKTSKLLGLRTEASGRFEKGVDPQIALIALDRAAELLQETARGTILKGIVDVLVKPFTAKTISCRIHRVNQILGTELSLREVVELLKRLDIEILSEEGEQLRCKIPSYRNDLHAEIDLIEEVARLYGYNNLPKRIPRHVSSPIPHTPFFVFEEEVRTRLIGEGLQELLTCNLISPELAAIGMEKGLSEEQLIHVLHPRSIDQSVLRGSLLPGLLQVVQHNLAHQNETLSGFEVGRIHFKADARFIEQSVAGIILTGSANPYTWDPKPRNVDFFDLKGHVENLLQAVGIRNATFKPSHLHSFHPGRQARVMIGEELIGSLGEVHPSILATFDIEQRVYFAELSLNDLLSLKKEQRQIAPLPNFPGSVRDWTLPLKEDLPIEAILTSILETGSRFLESVALLDLYKSPQIGKDRKNATFRLSYRDRDKTLSTEEVDQEHARIIQAVAEKLRNSIL